MPTVEETPSHAQLILTWYVKCLFFQVTPFGDSSLLQASVCRKVISLGKEVHEELKVKQCTKNH